SGVVTTLYTFAGSDGASPSAALTEGSDGNFYGTTVGGGSNDHGTVFKLTTSGTLTTLYAFAGDDGASPYGRLIEGTGGEFYGIPSFGGPDFNPSTSSFGNGEVFKITS